MIAENVMTILSHQKLKVKRFKLANGYITTYSQLIQICSSVSHSNRLKVKKHNATVMKESYKPEFFLQFYFQPLRLFILRR